MGAEIEISKFSDVCTGVKRAVRLTKKILKSQNEIYPIEDNQSEADILSSEKISNGIYTQGPIVHNSQLMEDMVKDGLIITDTYTNINKGKFIIRSHGIHPQIIKELKEKGIELIDATCPFVKRTQKICQQLKNDRYLILIIGDSNHPEVEALKGFAGDEVIIIDPVRKLGTTQKVRLSNDVNKQIALDKINFKTKKIGIVCQSTISKKNFNDCIFSIFEKNFNEARIFQTICLDTVKRQTEAEQMSKRCDVMLVVGGRMSANTKKLYQICKNNGTQAYYIKRPEKILGLYFKNSKRIGIIGGASTPYSLIKQVREIIEKRQSKVKVKVNYRAPQNEALDYTD